MFFLCRSNSINDGTSIHLSEVQSQAGSGYQLQTTFLQSGAVLSRRACLLTGYNGASSDNVPIITENGSPSSCDVNNPWLLWNFVSLSNGISQLVHQATGKCIGVPKAQIGFYPVTAPCDTNDVGQLWYLESNIRN